CASGIRLEARRSPAELIQAFLCPKPTRVLPGICGLYA
ncbi:MAG: hypothetical protein AVDCRST_MAG56-5700, partial [uncultured Cytophagales bacterium]